MNAMAAALGTGIFLGWLLTMVYAAAAISRAQQRMQRKVRYWQAEAARAREDAGQVAEQDRWQARDRAGTGQRRPR